MLGGYKIKCFACPVAVAGFFVLVFLCPDKVFARTNISASVVNITEDTIWMQENSPYVVSGWAWLDVNATLTIEPGVVVKFTPNHYLKRYNGILVSGGGKIIAQGTEENPIVFTSYYDDAHGGDTNGDGSSSLPGPGDWRGIVFDADESEISHVKIFYAANIYESYGAIEAKNGSSLSVSNSVIQYCKGSCVRLNEPTSASFSNSIISDSSDFGVYSTASGSAPSFSGITIQNCALGIATLPAANTAVFSNITLSGNKNIINFSGYSISRDSVWPKIGDSAYILRNDIEIAPGAVLVIDPGVVVKGEYGSYPDSRIEVYGRLIAQGTQDYPIIFTSFSDDSSAGDSNADGSAASPGTDDWGGLYFQDSSGSSLENVIMRYGGKYADDFNGVFYATTDDKMIHLKNSSLLVASSTIGIAKTAIYLEGASSLTMSGSVVGTTTKGILSYSSLGSVISASNFANNSLFAISNSGAQIDARNNWWGHDSGPAIASNPGGLGNAVSSNVLYSPWSVMILPNIAPVLSFVGSGGYASDGVEPNVSFVNSSFPVFKIAFSDADNDAAQYVRLVVGGASYTMSTSSGGVFEFTPNAGAFGKGSHSYHFEASDGLSLARLPTSGELGFEVRNVPVILVPGILGTKLYHNGEEIWANYWDLITDAGDDFMNVLGMNYDGSTMNNITTGDIIRDAPFTDVFAGLIEEFEDSGYVENTDLFVAPYDWRLDIRDSVQSLKQKIDDVVAQTSSERVNIIAHSMGGLLAKQYVLDNGSSAMGKIIFVGTPHLGAPKAAKALLFGDNMGVPGLDQMRIKYIGQFMPSVYGLLPSNSYFNDMGYYYYDGIQQIAYDYNQTKQFLFDSSLSSLLLSEAETFHSSAMDNFNPDGLDIYNINGCNKPTITRIIKRSDKEYAVVMFAGDETVPIASSDALAIDSSKIYYLKNTKHSTMPSADGVRELIKQIITDSEITLPDNATQDSSQCVVAGQLVSVHSPVNLHIYDSEGNHVGRGENGDIEYNISSVSYEEIGENKFVFLPESGGVEYRVELDGTDSGTFSLRVSKVEDNEITETAYYSDIPVNSSSEAQITLADSVSETILEVDETGTGSFETISVASVLNTEQSADTTKPTTSISTTGGTTSATFTLSATDDNSGILKTEYSLDNGTTWNNYTNSVIINSIGNTVVLFRSKDKAGNLEDYNTETIRVTSAAVILSPPIQKTEQRTEQAKQAKKEENIKKTTKKNIQSKVLGVEYERPFQEQEIFALYGKALLLDEEAIKFIAYGTETTKSLGAGERAGVVHSFKEAFGRMPTTEDDWADIARIATNQVPIQRNKIAEKKAKDIGAVDEKSIIMIAYGLRPIVRDIEKEKQGLKDFVKKYNRVPKSTLDWNILRSIVY